MLSIRSTARLGTTHPECIRRVTALAAKLAGEGIPIEIDQAIRTATQQNGLWALGRSLPGKIVTNAQAYQSNHVIGCAVDIAPDGSNGRPDWNAGDPAWQRIVELAPDYGLRDGKSWHDLPHLELIEIPTEPTKEIQDLCQRQGVRAVWDALEIPEFNLPA
jgi:peptidoglycan LD-endopeptidase CwlK